MAFCSNCGKEIESDAKFCANCGRAVEANVAPIVSTPITTYNEPKAESKREIIHEGSIRKCPNCGAVLSSYESICSSCGFELREVKQNEDIAEFLAELKEIRIYTQDPERRKRLIVDTIRDYNVHNTVESVKEFLLQAKSNIMNADKDGDGQINPEEREILVAWFKKFDEVYERGVEQNILKKETDIAYANKLKKEVEKIKKATIGNVNKNFPQNKKITVASIIGIICAMMGLIMGFTNGAIIAGIFAVVQVALFTISLLTNMGIIKSNVPKLAMLLCIAGYVMVIPYFSLYNL